MRKPISLALLLICLAPGVLFAESPAQRQQVVPFILSCGHGIYQLLICFSSLRRFIEKYQAVRMGESRLFSHPVLLIGGDGRPELHHLVIVTGFV